MHSLSTQSEGLERWRLLSADSRYRDLPPLPRLIQAVRDQSKTAEEILDHAFVLCESNLEIGKEELPTWQGLSVIDVTGVFCVEGLGGDLCRSFGYDFWTLLRTLADLARRSNNPAQYHQCINNNLFSSPADDALVLERQRSLEEKTDLRSRGCMVDTGKLLSSLAQPIQLTPENEIDSNLDSNHQQLVVTPRQTPQAYRGFGRSLKLRMDGDVLVRGPFCLNVHLERPFFWFASIQLQADWLSSSDIELHYQVQLDQDSHGPLRLLLATTAAEPAEPGRGERHFWLHQAELHHDGSDGVVISMDEANWLCLEGHPCEAYGLKCTAASSNLMNTLPVELILAMECVTTTSTPTGQLTLPQLKAVARKNKAS